MKAVIVSATVWLVVQTNSSSADVLYSEDFDKGQESLDVWWIGTDIWPTFLVNGQHDATSGDFVITPHGDIAGFAVVDEIDEVKNLEDVSIRTQVRTDGDTGAFGLVGRFEIDEPDSADYHFYQGGYNVRDGRLYLGYNQPSHKTFTTLENVEFDIELGVNLQLDVIDNKLDLWAWDVGNARPIEPQLTFTDDEIGLTAGMAGVIFDPFDQPDSAIKVTIQSLHIANASIDVIDEAISLKAGDADQDLDFDQLDLVKVQIAANYLTGQAATWGEGDWDGAPGGTPGNPPPGNGLFDQLDVIAALGSGTYLTGPYAAVHPNGQPGDGQTSVVYNSGTGELSVDALAGVELTSINIDSAEGIFTGEAAQSLGGSFDNDVDSNIFKATFGSSFGSLSFGSVAQAGLTEEFVLGDLSVVGSLAGGGDLGNVDLVFVPEPAALGLLILGLVVSLSRLRQTPWPAS